MRRLRYWLIRKLAGDDMILGNAAVTSATFTTLNGRKGFAFNTTATAWAPEIGDAVPLTSVTGGS